MENMLSTARLNSRERVREDPLVEEAYKATKKAIMNWRDLLRSLPDEYPAHEWISDFRKWLITCDAVYFDHMEALGMERDKALHEEGPHDGCKCACGTQELHGDSSGEQEFGPWEDPDRMKQILINTIEAVNAEADKLIKKDEGNED